MTMINMIINNNNHINDDLWDDRYDHMSTTKTQFFFSGYSKVWHSTIPM